MIGTAAAVLAGGAAAPFSPRTSEREAWRAQTRGLRVPLVHVTDLYHPPQDPDDQVDLATIASLPELELRGVVLDVTRRFLLPEPAGFDVARDPGFITVAQLGYLTGRAIPVAAGPLEPLRDAADDASDRPVREQAGVELLLHVLENSETPVVISIVGSARVVAAAWNRAPDLMRDKTRAVLLNAGMSGGRRLEWNVQLDPEAYAAIWRSDLPVDWYPCATENSPFDLTHERSPYWRATHRALFDEIPAALRGWFAYGLSGSARGDFIRALEDMGKGAVWEHILSATRHLWATPSLVMAAGRVLARQEEGWRFVPAGSDAADLWPWRLDPVRIGVDADGHVAWEPVSVSDRRLFGRRPGAEFSEAMAEALNALLRDAPI